MDNNQLMIKLRQEYHPRTSNRDFGRWGMFIDRFGLLMGAATLIAWFTLLAYGM